MAYVIGDLEATIQSGKIISEVRDLVLHEGPRPKTAYEFGGDPEQIGRLNNRMPGKISTLVRLGVGCALVVENTQNLSWLSDEKQMDKVAEKIGELKNIALLGSRRNIMAGGTWLCQDICAGVLEEEDIVAGALRELVEVGLSTDQEGWGKYVLADPYSIYQNVITKEQEKTWQIMAPASLWPCGASLLVEPVQGLTYDNINGMDCLISGESNSGSLEFILVLKTSLPPEGGGWEMRDLETGFNQVNNKWFLLNRQPLAIFPRKVGRPVQLGFGPNGLDLDYPIVVLDHDNLQMNTNQKVQIVMDRLGWL
ncbi:hypothetical protein COT68_00595 [bacterium (Candidatus Torokbacteria) CG09_land_8_20_14_0_10_42_11]|nr:MAG: hypothetical protein COT68_00595 [bacterium (Candidatus Torokbacteria) CG09_land_8_20_14_0_10_42_11]